MLTKEFQPDTKGYIITVRNYFETKLICCTINNVTQRTVTATPESLPYNYNFKSTPTSENYLKEASSLQSTSTDSILFKNPDDAHAYQCEQERRKHIWETMSDKNYIARLSLQQINNIEKILRKEDM